MRFFESCGCATWGAGLGLDLFLSWDWRCVVLLLGGFSLSFLAGLGFAESLVVPMFCETDVTRLGCENLMLSPVGSRENPPLMLLLTQGRWRRNMYNPANF